METQTQILKQHQMTKKKKKALFLERHEVILALRLQILRDWSTKMGKIIQN